MDQGTLGTTKIRVLVVDDSAFVRRAIIRIFEQNTEIQIVDVASDGEMALDLIKKLRPDVVTLDVQMPVLDGIAALERIMKECPTPVIMLSSLTGKGGDKTLKALELGAVDFIDKSAAGGPMDISGLARELTGKILVAAKVDLRKMVGIAEAPPVTPRTAGGKLSDTEVVMIGTSTGGPPALQAILGKLPADFPCPILMVQHMPVGFTESLAGRLDRVSPLRVKEAEEGGPDWRRPLRQVPGNRSADIGPPYHSPRRGFFPPCPGSGSAPAAARKRTCTAFSVSPSPPSGSVSSRCAPSRFSRGTGSGSPVSWSPSCSPARSARKSFSSGFRSMLLEGGACCASESPSRS